MIVCLPPWPSLQNIEKEGALVEASFATFDTAVGATAVPELVKLESYDKTWTVDKTKYNNDFGAYFGVGLGACVVLLAFIGYQRKYGPKGPAEFNARAALEAAEAEAAAKQPTVA